LGVDSSWARDLHFENQNEREKKKADRQKNAGNYKQRKKSREKELNGGGREVGDVQPKPKEDQELRRAGNTNRS